MTRYTANEARHDWVESARYEREEPRVRRRTRP